jgi:hypothetical protein
MDNLIRSNGKDTNESVGLLTGLLIGELTGLGAIMHITLQSGKKNRTQRKHLNKDDNEIKIHVPGEPQEAAKNIPNWNSSTRKTKDQVLSEELLANDSLGG